VISLIWSLAEASEKTLQGVNAAGVEGLLVKVLEGREVFGTGVALAACESGSLISADQVAQALYSLSQDNEPFREALLAQPTALPTLKNIVREVHDTGTANGKGKAPKSNGGEAEEEIGRAALIRLLTSGESSSVSLETCLTERRCFAESR
jgi:hypothetical protein